MNNKHSRRTFVELTATGLATGILSSLGACAEDSDEQGNGFEDDGTGGQDSDSEGAESETQGEDSGGEDSGESGGDNADESSESGEPAACAETPSDIEGPYYREDIPIRSKLDLYDHEGVPLYLSGQVLDRDCTPIPNAVVELWHATPVKPDAEPGDEDATYDESEEFQYYGQIATDAEGRYAFETLRPGWYLNGSQYRPAHLHIKVWIGDVEKAQLTTQLYFEGDEFNAIDPWFNAETTLSVDDDGQTTYDLHVGS